MPVRGRDHVQPVGLGDVLGKLVLQPQRVEPVAVDAADDDRNLDRPQRGGHPASSASHVVGRHRVGEGDVRAGVESVGELAGVMVEIALHGVATVRQRVLTLLWFSTEPDVELGLGAVGEVGDAPGDAHADMRTRRRRQRRGSHHRATSGRR